jgi:ubiquinone/menaquinone biosynthesis C-methylase UbiE
MMNFEADKKSIVLDLGCGEGYFARVLSLQSITIALDVDKRAIVKAQVQAGENKLDKLHFIVADVSSLPFRSHSINVVVCASVLEHIQDLDGVAKQIRDVLKEDGIFVSGYPIETKFFKLVWRLVSPRNFRCIDQNQTFWYNHYTHKHYCYWECPFTHKQDYQVIRGVLRKYFMILRKEKLPFDVLSDSLSYYECVKCTPT